MTAVANPLVVCAYSPCRRQYGLAAGCGVFCSQQCFVDECNHPGTFAPGLTLAEARDDSPTDTEILERLIAIGEVGPVRKYDTWCYGGERYPDARSALVAFMRATA